MKTKHVESMEELVFKNRNKDYGAYSLRKNYSNHIVISLFIAVLFLGSALTYPLIMNRGQKETNTFDTLIITADPFGKTIHDPPEIPSPPPSSLPQKMDKNLAFTIPKVTSDSIDNNFGKQDLLADNKPAPVSTVETPDQTQPEKPEPVIPQPEKPEPLLVVPEMPHFPGGEAEMSTFLVNHIKYPNEAREINIQGTVFLSFVIETDGTITEIKILRGIGGGCEEEALRVVKSMPYWVPGKQNGHAVRVRLTLPVKFTLHG